MNDDTTDDKKTSELDAHVHVETPLNVDVDVEIEGSRTHQSETDLNPPAPGTTLTRPDSQTTRTLLAIPPDEIADEPNEVSTEPSTGRSEKIKITAGRKNKNESVSKDAAYTIPESNHPKQQRRVPKSYRQRASRDQNAPLPFFRKPPSGEQINPPDLRRPAEVGTSRKPNRPSKADAARVRAQREASKNGQLPSPDDLAEAERLPLDPAEFWSNVRLLYQNDPVGFTQDILGVQPDEWQAEAMDAIARGERRLSVRAGHGVGKSAFCAWLIVWHAVTKFPQKTVITAPTAGQLFDALFPEVRSWFRKLPLPILNLFELQSEGIIFRANPDDSFISARTASKDKPESLAGIHCELGSVLIVADEASAIPEEVYESASGSMSGKTAHTILISNPTKIAGLFYDTHHRMSDRTVPRIDAPWKTMHVSCLGNSRVAPDFVQQTIDTYGLDSNAYRVRVLGEFTTAEDNVLIPIGLIESATKRDIAEDPHSPLVYGVDVARFGDDKTVLVKRRGNVVVGIIWWAKLDLMQTVGRIVQEAKLDSPSEICVDSIGVGGGVGDRLRELKFNARDVNVSESSPMNPSAHRLRDDLWLQVRDWLQTMAVRIPDDENLINDLKAPTYGFSDKNKIVVESKALMKRRKVLKGRSPDFADALCMTFAGQAALLGGRTSGWGNRTGPLKRNIASMRGI